MSRKPYQPEKIIAKLREADVLLSQGRGCGEGDVSGTVTAPPPPPTLTPPLAPRANSPGLSVDQRRRCAFASNVPVGPILHVPGTEVPAVS